MHLLPLTGIPIYLLSRYSGDAPARRMGINDRAEFVVSGVYFESRLTSLRWQLIADRNEWPTPCTVIRRFLFELVGTMSLDRND